MRCQPRCSRQERGRRHFLTSWAAKQMNEENGWEPELKGVTTGVARGTEVGPKHKDI